VGGYSDWKREDDARRERADAAKAREEAARKAAEAPKSEAAPAPGAKRKLSYKETRELEALPGLIETLEAEQAALGEAMADPSFYRKPAPEIAAANERVQKVADEIHAAYARWEELGG